MYYNILYELLLPFGVSLFSALLATYVVRIIALDLGWISIPRKERWNSRYVALMGGIAVFISFVLTTILFLKFQHTLMIIGGSIMFATGFWDDRFELKPLVKFILQFIAASILVVAGYTINSAWPFWLAIPLTYLWVVGITNAFNLLDNMDGLAGGIAAIVSFCIGILALKLGLNSLAVLAFILAGSVGGFLFFNYNPAKIFMGDCGSLFIGYTLAVLPLMLEPALSSVSSASVLPILVALTILPIFDTTLVTLVRIFKGRSPSQGGRDHTSHRLVVTGLSEKAAVNSLYLIATFFGIIILLFYPENIALFHLLFTIGITGLFFFGLYLSNLDVYQDEKISSIESMVENLPSYLKRKIQLGAIIVDIILIVVSFALAHYIRFEGWTLQIENAIIEAIPGIIILKVLLLAIAGLYNSVWKYAGVADMVKVAIATFMGSLASGIYAWVLTGGYISMSVFAIDWLLFFFLLSSSRFAFKGLRRILALPTNGGRNVLIYGAGDAGWLALSEIRQNSDLNLNPVGYLDDSPYKQKSVVQGLKVLGSLEGFNSISKNYEIDEVLICIRNLPSEKKEQLKNECIKRNIICREFIPAFYNLELKNESKSDEDLVNFEY